MIVGQNEKKQSDVQTKFSNLSLFFNAPVIYSQQGVMFLWQKSN